MGTGRGEAGNPQSSWAGRDSMQLAVWVPKDRVVTNWGLMTGGDEGNDELVIRWAL